MSNYSPEHSALHSILKKHKYEMEAPYKKYGADDTGHYFYQRGDNGLHRIRVSGKKSGEWNHSHNNKDTTKNGPQELDRHLAKVHTNQYNEEVVEPNHVTPERARELVESSPNLHPIRSGFVAEPLVQFKEEKTEQFSENGQDIIAKHGYTSVANAPGLYKHSASEHQVEFDKGQWKHYHKNGLITTHHNGLGHDEKMAMLKNHLDSIHK